MCIPAENMRFNREHKQNFERISSIVLLIAAAELHSFRNVLEVRVMLCVCVSAIKAKFSFIFFLLERVHKQCK